MASKRISELDAISSLDDDDVLLIVEDGENRQVTVAELRSALFPGWTDWASTVDVVKSADGTTILGTGPTKTGRYFKAGRTVTGWGNATVGTSPSVGAAGLRFLLPVMPAANTIAIGVARLRDSSPVAKTNVVLISDTAIGATGSAFASPGAGSSEDWDFDTPFTPAVGDTYNWSFTYEAAA